MGVTKKHVPGCTCCGVGCDPCEACTGDTPCTLTVTISGITNGDTCCDTINGDYTVTQTAESACLWRYDGTICSGAYNIRVDFSFADITYTRAVYVRITNPDTTLAYEILTNDAGSTTDCMTFSLPSATLVGVAEYTLHCVETSLAISVSA